MIQRAQSLFLFIISVLMLLLLYVNIWEIHDSEKNETVILNAFQIKHIEADKGETEVIKTHNSYFIAILAILSAGTSLFSVFKYKNRMLQLKLGLLNTLLMIGILGLVMLYVYKMEEILPQAQEGSFKIGLFFPAIGLILNWLANRFIRKDEKLVRSADRFRD